MVSIGAGGRSSASAKARTLHSARHATNARLATRDSATRPFRFGTAVSSHHSFSSLDCWPFIFGK